MKEEWRFVSIMPGAPSAITSLELKRLLLSAINLEDTAWKVLFCFAVIVVVVCKAK